MPDTTAVILVNWNGSRETAACLASLEGLADEGITTFVVDNGSTDDSVSRLRRDFPDVALVESRENRGYAGGCNLGLRAALESGADSLVVANNDTLFEPGLVRGLREATARDPSIGLAGAPVFRQDGEPRFWYAGGELTRKPFRVRELTDPATIDRAEPFDVGYVPGCVMHLRRSVLDRVGFLDERLFLTWEDTDWSWRVREAGLRTVIVPGTRILHRGSLSFAGLFSPLYCYYFFRNMLLFAHLHFPGPERPGAYRNVLGFARGVRRRTPSNERTAVTRALVLGIVHFVIGRYGPAPAFLTRRVQTAREETS